jgi:CheY-like chemotaxis protein
MPLPSTAPSKIRKATTKHTLLIADSDKDSLDVARQYLLLRGYEVETTTGGVECVDKLRRHNDMILILDIKLPWGGGDGVLDVMRGDSTLAQIPVIPTSEQPKTEMPLVSVSPPFPHILLKPYSLKSLLDSIHSATGGKSKTSVTRSVGRIPPRSHPGKGSWS